MAKFLLKVDISGIQDYIFSIPSDGAAKQLKKRSFEVYTLTHIAEAFFKEHFPNGFERVYNGGGNLIVFLNGEEEALSQAAKEFQNTYINDSVFPFVAFVAVPENYNDEVDFPKLMEDLADKMQRQKYRRPLDNWEKLKVQDTNKDDEKTDNFIRDFLNAKGFSVEKSANGEDVSMAYKAVLKSTNPEFSFEGNILNKLPKGSKDTISSFDEIAEKCKARGADDKLAALKMDVDNLGLLFRNRSRKQYEEVSQLMENFFSKELFTLLKSDIESGDVYPVFAGGDDCFFIGGWDVILEVAPKIQAAFDEFVRADILRILTDEEIQKNPPTISAGVVIVHRKFPMIRLAEEAEEALGISKSHGKNKITIFGEPLKWSDFKESAQWAVKLKKLITENNESRALLHRVKSSDLGFVSLQEKIHKTNKIEIPKVYRLKYYLRNAKSAEGRAELEKLFVFYAEALIDDFMRKDEDATKKPNAAAPFVVAARWAELSLKNYKPKNTEYANND
ncbi:CRISPR-associated protein Csm1 [Cruoricaptor ignavus]|uniref:CRISPR-associated protein Csm1 n=1 Tax=Cruoricaptor ignavus TaxID=1118202 RepID=A0A1M6DKE3_9FLAO|nr:hypothetical protein [Cruoricaptor ignavus]SHI73640.1 CRISPR-associated protein Csm1 [Cruoricaptor ignavus]